MRAHRLQQLEHAGVVDAGPQASSRSSSECGSRRPTRRRRHRTRVVWSRPRSIPRLQATMSAPPPPEPRAATPAAPATPPAARNPPPREPAPGRHWRDETPRTGCDATPRPTAAPACRVARPGACVPYLDTNSRHDRNASAPGTRCSMTAGIKASSTWPVRPRRKFGSRRCAAATAGCSGTKSLASSARPAWRAPCRQTPRHRCPTPRNGRRRAQHG